MLRALVTRPRHQAGELVAGLQARGIACLVEPMLEILPRPWDPRSLLAGPQAVLLTSANAAEALLRAVAGRALPLPPILAVGPATARPLCRAGLQLGVRRIEAAGGDAADLLRLVRRRLDPRGGPVLHLSGEAIACDLGAALAADGYAVERHVVYAARPATRLSARLRAALADGGIQLAPFLSCRTAMAFRDLVLATRLESACRGMVGVALSPRIAAAMRPLPWCALATAARPDLRSLLAALDASLAGIVDAAFGRPAMP